MAQVIMFDAVNADAIPADAAIVAGYVDGRWPSFFEMVLRFPRAEHVSITTGVDPAALVLDRERGDATESQAAGWAVRRLGLKVPSVIYCEKSDEPAVAGELRELGVGFANPAWWPAPVIYWWAADWDGVEHLDTGSIGTQYASPGIGLPGGAGYDLSEVGYGFPYLTPAAAGDTSPPAPNPKPLGDPDMKWILDPVTKNQYLADRTGLTHLDPSQLPSAAALTGQATYITMPDDQLISKMAGYDPEP